MKNIIILLLIVFVNVNAQWNQIAVIPSSPVLKSVKFFDRNNGLIGGSNGIWKTTDGGNNWIQILTNAVNSMWSVDLLNTYGLGTTARVYKTTDGGQNWSTYIFTNGFTATYSIAFFNVNTGVAVGFHGIVNRTIDAGLNWYRQDSVYFQEQSYVFAISSGHGVITGGPLYEQVDKTGNYGASWTGQGGFGLGELKGAYMIDGNNFYVCGSNGVIRKTTNYGTTWTRLDSITNRRLYAVMFSNNTHGTIVGDYGTIIRTTNSGTNLTMQTSGTGNALYSVWFISRDTGWVVGSNGVVLKTINGGVTQINTISSVIPNKFSLSQNYPNPFNPNTKIKFDIQSNVKRQTSNTKLIIYDVLGNEVSTLVNEQLKPGTYEVEWDGSNFASGVYCYQLISGDFRETKKMLMIK